MRSRRYLLDPRSTAEDVGVVADKLRWPLIGELKEDLSRLESHEVIWGKTHDLTLHYQDDLSHGARTRSLREKMRGGCGPSRILKQQLKPATLEELLEAADTVRSFRPRTG